MRHVITQESSNVITVETEHTTNDENIKNSLKKNEHKPFNMRIVESVNWGN
jgi:hypothetical protein